LRKISQLNKLNLVRGLPNLKFSSDALCEACQKGKFTKRSFKAKNIVSTSRPLELLHIDLFGLVKTASFGGKKYGLVIVDDYSRWTWVKFLRHRDESHSVFSTFCSQVQNEMNCKVIRVRSDHGGEFENKDFDNLFDSNGITRDLSCPRTPQQNEVVERNNMTLQEMARTLIQETYMAKHLWAEAVNTTCYIQNRISIRPNLGKTPYELWKNRKPNISYLHPFGCICYMLNTKDKLGKFDSKALKCFLVGYSEISKGYRVYDILSKTIVESIYVRFEDKLDSDKSKLAEKFAYLDITSSESEDKNKALEDKESEDVEPEATASEDVVTTSDPRHQKKNRITTSHPEELILGNKDAPVRTRSAFKPSEENLISLKGLVSLMKLSWKRTGFWLWKKS
jgi:transposase InsO family protein